MAKVARLQTRPLHGLLTLQEAADYLKIAPGTLKNWVSARRIAYVKVGSLTRFEQRDLDQFVLDNRVDVVNR